MINFGFCSNKETVPYHFIYINLKKTNFPMEGEFKCCLCKIGDRVLFNEMLFFLLKCAFKIILLKCNKV